MSGPNPWTRRVEWGLLAVGIGLRSVRFLEGRPLWIDEALIALNVVPNGPAEFLQPLAYSQISPLGFLLGEWLVTRVAGAGEQALRFLPFVASVAALIAFNRLVRRTLESGPALFATALAAVSPLLIYYSGEVKSYTFDWLCAVLLMHATLTVAADPTPRAWTRWALIAAFGALMSTPAPFFVAGCALALLAVAAFRTPRALLRLAAAVTPAALLFAAQYLTTYDSPYTRAVMDSYWTRQFLDAQPRDALVQAVQAARTFVIDVVFGDQVANALPRKSITITLLLSAIGTLVLLRRSLTVALMVFAPAALAGVAALMHRWPLTSRLLLFLVPALLMALASGVSGLTQLLPARARGVVLATIASVFFVSSAAGNRWEWTENNLVIALPDALRSVSQSGDSTATVYVSSDLVPACRYYLAWHPDRIEMGGGVDGARTDSTTMCARRTGRIIAGQWPLFVRRTPGAPFNAPMPVQPEWIEQEGNRVLSTAGNHLWLILAHSRQLQDALPPWLESHGFKRVEESRKRTLFVVEYQR